MRPGMHTPSYEGTPPVVDGLISTYASGEVESITLQIEDFIPPDHTRANYAGLVLHDARARNPVLDDVTGIAVLRRMT